MKNKHGVACAAVAAMMLGSAVVPMSAFADSGECDAGTTGDTCMASTMEALQLGLANDNVRNITINGGIMVENDEVLDISGKVLLTNSVDGAFLIVSGGSLTVEGSETPATCGNPQALTSLIQANGVLFNVSGTGRLNLNGGMSCSIDTVAVAVHSGGTVTVAGGNVSSATSVAIAGGVQDTGDMNVYIIEGEVSGAKSAIYMPAQGILDISGGFVNGGIVARMGQINVSGGATIWGRMGNGSVKDVLDGGVTSLPVAIAALTGLYTSHNEEHGNSLNINITGGNFNSGVYGDADAGSYSGAVKVFDAGKLAQEVTVNITGGEFYGAAGESLVDYYTRREIIGENSTVQNEADFMITGGVYHGAEPKTNYIGNGYKSYYEVRTIKVPAPDGSGLTEASRAGYMVAKGAWPTRVANVEIVQEAVTEDLRTQDIDDAIRVLYDVTARDAEGNEVLVNDEEITLTVRLDKELMRGDEQYFQVAYVADDGVLTTQRFAAEIEERGNEYLVTFTTTHLSQYAVMASANPFTIVDGSIGNTGKPDGEDDGAGTPNTGMMTKISDGASMIGASVLAATAVMIVLTAAVTKATLRKKHWRK